MSKKILLHQDARKELLKGVDILANAVKVTLGPQGSNVMIERQFGTPGITKDGISVAREVLLEDRTQNMAASFVRSAASKTNEKAGDGTTGATVLTQAIVREALFALDNGASAVQLKRGISKGAEVIINHLKGQAVTIKQDSEDLKNIAYISANNDRELGDLIGEAYSKVGKGGIISVEQSKSTETYVELAGGMKVASGYLHPYFVNEPKRGEVALEDVKVLICADKITTFKPLIRVLDNSISEHKSLLIIGDVSGEALETLLINRMEANAKLCIIKPPAFGEKRQALLEDIAIITGGVVIAKDKGKPLHAFKSTYLGECTSTRTDFHDTILTGAKGTEEMIQFRKDEIQANKKLAENDYEEKKLEERIAALEGNIGVIYVGAPTEEEMKEKIDRVEDAKNATKAALEEGVVCGGGIALLKASKDFDIDSLDKEYIAGATVLYKALLTPLETILTNADVEVKDFEKKWLERKSDNFGFDAKNLEYKEDMIEAGIIDPLKVIRIALENAASAGGMIITTACTITTTLPPQSK